jgi:phage/plasmid-like protein (TIGR03299 family)
MAHNIDSMAYAGDLPWHGLGTYVGDENVNAERMITAAGLDWHVRKVAPTFGAILDNEGHKAGEMELRALDHVALVRSDSGAILGTAKRGYEIFDNAEMFRFLDSFAADGRGHRGGGLRYHTAGALFNGERVWALASLEGSEVTLRRADGSPDTLASFLLCVAGHDGAHAVTLQPTSVRVVCFNTLSAALREEQPMRFSIKHTASLPDKLDRAREALVGAVEHTRQLAELGTELDKQRMGAETFARFALALVLNVDADTERDAGDLVREQLDGASDRIKARTENAVAALYSCFAEGIGNGGSTRWDALNAVTEWIDHQRGRASKGRQTAEQLSRAAESAWSGTGADRKARAVRMLTRW